MKIKYCLRFCPSASERALNFNETKETLIPKSCTCIFIQGKNNSTLFVAQKLLDVTYSENYKELTGQVVVNFEKTRVFEIIKSFLRSALISFPESLRNFSRKLLKVTGNSCKVYKPEVNVIET